ncbi:MAG: hypothetical protein NTU61_00515 [Candidatus Altiarchaeota archaeon]|nr:hypothetical protein [Candidatus Altiarchaeota archaeon]
MAEKRNIVSKFLDKLDKKVEEKSKKKGCGCCCSSGECGKE